MKPRTKNLELRIQRNSSSKFRVLSSEFHFLSAAAIVVAALLASSAARGAAAGYAHPEILVDTEWLAAHANDPNIRIVDMRTSGYAQGHIPGAVHLDNAAIRANRPPTFLPTADEFAGVMGALGIGNRTRVIAYDDRGGIYAARLWFVLTAFGHPNAALLNGGWTKWTLDRRATPAGTPAPAPAVFHATLDMKWVATADDVLAAIDKPGVRIVDARTPAEIDGADLRGIARGGHVPSSVPVYWEDELDPQTKMFKPADAIAALYRDRGVRSDDSVIAYCQIGMRASHDVFALTLIGHPKLRVYYGSWEEWGNRTDLPIRKGS